MGYVQTVTVMILLSRNFARHFIMRRKRTSLFVRAVVRCASCGVGKDSASREGMGGDVLEWKERKRKHANLRAICGGPALTLRMLLRLRLLLRPRDFSLCAEGRLNSSLVFGV